MDKQRTYFLFKGYPGALALSLQWGWRFGGGECPRDSPPGSCLSCPAPASWFTGYHTAPGRRHVGAASSVPSSSIASFCLLFLPYSLTFPRSPLHVRQLSAPTWPSQAPLQSSGLFARRWSPCKNWGGDTTCHLSPEAVVCPESFPFFMLIYSDFTSIKDI